MHVAKSNIIVSYRGVSRGVSRGAAGGEESFESTPPSAEEMARQAAMVVEPDPGERERLLARYAQALKLLRDCADEVDEDLLQSPQSQDAAILQSLLAKKPDGNLVSSESGGEELQFATNDLFGWFRSLFSWFKQINKRDIKRPRSSVPDPLSADARIFLAADFGTGLYGAPIIRDTILTNGQQFDMMLHLGDIYYAGTTDEIRDRFLPTWPGVRGKINRALNGNHEMYSGGEGYFDLLLYTFQQPSSYFAMQNRHWLLLCLDTAYVDHSIDDEQARWVWEVAQQSENRRIVLFSHHQLFSPFDDQGPNLSKQLYHLLTSGRVAAWYWGHVHQCVIHDPHPSYGLRARCIGHGGMPYLRTKEIKSLPVSAGTTDASTLWKKVPERDLVPGGIVLDGPNADIRGKEEKYGPNGYMTLAFQDGKITETVHSARGVELWKSDLT
jgi:predicted phosphodiesterase